MRPPLRRSLFILAAGLLMPSGLVAATGGVVFDPQGRPVAGARVTAFRWEPALVKTRRLFEGAARPELAAATTNDAGAFVLEGNSSGVLELSIERDGFAPLGALALGGDDQLAFTLTPAARRTGRVTANGKPVAGALVVAFDDAAIRWTTRTDADGRYTIADPKPWASQLDFVHPDFAPLHRNDFSTLDVVLQPGSNIAGSVLDAAGAAVPNATVVAGVWRMATTGDDGAFVLRHAGNDEKSVVAFTSAASGRGTRGAQSTAIRMARLPAIAGVVRDAKGRALAGVPVFAFPADRRNADFDVDANGAVSDEKGSYAIPHVDPGRYELFAYGAGDVTFNRASAAVRDVSTARVDLTATAVEMITGMVVDEQKRPVAGASVQYSAAGMPLVYGSIARLQMPSARSGANGRFRLPKPRLDASAQALHLQAVRRGYAAGTGEARGAAPVTIVMPAGVELAGIVTDDAGKPVAGAGLGLVQDPTGTVPMPIETAMASGALLPFVETDANGRFAIRVNAGAHDLGVWKEGYAGARAEVMAAPDAKPLTITLKPGVEIRGRVVSSTKESLAGVVSARTGEMTAATVPVADDGTFVIRGLDRGAYELDYMSHRSRFVQREVTAPAANVVLELPALTEYPLRVVGQTDGAFRSYTLEFNDEVHEVPGGETFTLMVPPEGGEVSAKAEGHLPATHKIPPAAERSPGVSMLVLTAARGVAGTVRDEKGAPIAGARITVAERYGLFAESGVNGEFRLDAPEHYFTLQVAADGYRRRGVEVQPGEGDARVDVVLPSGREVAGHVFASDGGPAAGATVEASGRESFQVAQTDAGGAFTLRGLGEGRITLQAKRDGLRSDEVTLADPIPPDVHLMLKPAPGTGRVHGVVEGFDTGKWTEGFVSSSSGAFALIRRDGSYVIDRVEAGVTELQASARSGSRDVTSAPVKVTVIAGGDVEANLAFRTDVVVRGVVTESGAPAVARRVEFSSGRMRWTATTDEQGVYEIAGIEPGIMYDVQVVGGRREFETRHHVTGSGTFDINVAWVRLTGRVADADDNPVVEARVHVDTAASSIQSTAGNGLFSVEVPQKPYVMTITKPGFATATKRGEPDGKFFVVRMTPAEGLRVRLTDARSGATLDGYVVAVDAAGLEIARTSEPESDGAMLLPVAKGNYRIAVSADGYASQSARTGPMQTGELRFALTPGGTLVIRADRATADLVKLVEPDGEEYVRCHCNGVAEIRLTGLTTTVGHVAAGAYVMQLLDPAGKVKATQPVTIVEGQTTTVDVQVPQ